MKKIFFQLTLLSTTFILATENIEIVNTQSSEIEIQYTDTEPKPEKKSWTIITYMAADNNLGPFARRNLREQGQGNLVNIHRFVHLDIRITGNKKITKRYVIEENKFIIKNNPHMQAMDSGNPHTLIDCCKNAIELCPADHYILDIWNHGSGPKDIYWQSRIIVSPEVSFLNPINNLIELNRAITFSDYMHKITEDRGICFDETTGHYLTNQALEYALKTVCEQHLGGKKFDIIAFDACFMSTIEIANIVKDYANIIVASQEIEWATGWRYDLVLAPFAHKSLDAYEFASHIVKVYGQTYSHITNDYTLSAINLEKITLFESIIDHLSTLLIECLKTQTNKSVTKAIKTSKHKLLCTNFYDPDYIDAHHFLSNLLTSLKIFSLDTQHEQSIINELRETIIQAQHCILELVFANTVGKNLQDAKGISIYFPENKIHPSYSKNKFCMSNHWLAFLNHYLQSI